MKRLLLLPALPVTYVLRLRRERDEARALLADRVAQHMACLRVAARYEQRAERVEWALSEFRQPSGERVEPLGIWDETR